MSEKSAVQPRPPAETDAPQAEDKKKKKRKYSKGLKDLQQLERGVSKAMHRLAGSVDEGLRTWRKATERSARAQRDGAIRDALKNYAKATSRGLRVASWVPLDLAEALPRLNPRRVLARLLLPIYKK
jgi:hypothetical protein